MPSLPTMGEPGASTPFIGPLIQYPPLDSAGDVDVADDAEVIGVSVGDRHRAYLLIGLGAVQQHVVNDVIADTPVTVTYCDRSNCARVLTKKGATSALQLTVGGLTNGELLLRFDGKFFRQDAQNIPLEDAQFERTTWKAWREAHPQTEIYTGK